MQKINDVLKQAIESRTGESLEQLRSSTIAERRLAIEKKLKGPVTFHRDFPFIGRGNINGENTQSGEGVEHLLDQALND